jgi:hypothetical protein
MPRARFSLHADDGSASLEFITAGMILLLPLVYLVMTVSVIQAGAFAVEGAARQAVRVFVQSGTQQQAEARAQRAIEFALADYGLEASAAQVSVECSPRPSDCLRRGATVTVSVAVTVALPLIPPGLTLNVPASIPLQASATERVSRFWRPAP